MATFSHTFGSAGNHTIKAVYGGTNNFASQSTTVSQTVKSVGKTTTQTTLGSSANPSAFGESVTFTATVSSGDGTPTGFVTFIVAGVSHTKALVSGQATYTTSALGAGNHTITANYSGDTNFATSHASLTQTVNGTGVVTHLSATIVLVNGAYNLTVDALDAAGAVVKTYNAPATVSIVSGPPGAILVGPLATNFVNGVAEFDGLSLTESGTYTLGIFSGGFETTVTFTTSGRQR
jgi:hypothetical protein